MVSAESGEEICITYKAHQNTDDHHFLLELDDFFFLDPSIWITFWDLLGTGAVCGAAACFPFLRPQAPSHPVTGFVDI